MPPWRPWALGPTGPPPLPQLRVVRCFQCLDPYPDTNSFRIETNPNSPWRGIWVCPECFDGPDPLPRLLGPEPPARPPKGF